METRIEPSKPWSSSNRTSAPRGREREERTDDPAWREAFRRGDAEVMEACYRRHYRTVEAAIGTVLGPADRETVVHEVFCRLLAEPEMRESFAGPSLGAWLSAVARNRALDVSRRARRESLVGHHREEPETTGGASTDDEAVTRVLLDRFRRKHLPPAWAPVFDARFLCEMSQREAAQHLGMRRTTLAYQEGQMRRSLQRFMRDTDD
jgi:RNA polymerase sigma-70 factor (ECF subfamily)